MSGHLTDAEIQELLAAYALDAVEPDERDAIDLYLREHPEARDEVANHLEVAALLAHSGAPAPESLWDRIASALDEPPPAMRLAVVPKGGSSGPAPFRGGPADALARVEPVAAVTPLKPHRPWIAAVGAAAAAVVLVLGIQALQDDDRPAPAELAVDLESQAGRALADPDATKVDLVSDDSEAKATAVVMPDGTGFLVSPDLPALADDRTYQLWGVMDEGQIVSLGVLGPEPRVSAFQVDDSIDAFAVTDEVEGGVVSSSNPAVVAGELS